MTQNAPSVLRALTVKQVPGTDELFLEFTPDLLAELGWLPGDELEWTMGPKAGQASIANLSKAAREAASEARP